MVRERLLKSCQIHLTCVLEAEPDKLHIKRHEPGFHLSVSFDWRLFPNNRFSWRLKMQIVQYHVDLIKITAV